MVFQTIRIYRAHVILVREVQQALQVNANIIGETAVY